MKTLCLAIFTAMALISCSKDSVLPNESNEQAVMSVANRNSNADNNNDGPQNKVTLEVDFSFITQSDREATVRITDLDNGAMYEFASLEYLPVIQTAKLPKHHKYMVEFRNFNQERATPLDYASSCNITLYWPYTGISLLTNNQYTATTVQPITFSENKTTMYFYSQGCALN